MLIYTQGTSVPSGTFRKTAGAAFAVAILTGVVVLPASPDVRAQQTGASAQQQIVGVWKMVSSVNTSKDGVVTKGTSYGPNPAGEVIFTASGHYANVFTNPNIPKFASGNRMQGTPEEYKAVVVGSLAGYGTYSVSQDGRTLTVRQEGGTWALRNGKDDPRDLAITGDEMKWIVNATIGGKSELIFKRVK